MKKTTKKVSKKDTNSVGTIIDQISLFSKATLSVLRSEIDDAIRLQDGEDRLLNKLPAEDRKDLIHKWNKLNELVQGVDLNSTAVELMIPTKIYINYSLNLTDKEAIIDTEIVDSEPIGSCLGPSDYDINIKINKLPEVVALLRPANELLKECKVLVNKAARKLKVKNIEVWRALEIDGDW
jgi:hypothetical protein